MTKKKNSSRLILYKLSKTDRIVFMLQGLGLKPEFIQI